MTRKWSAPRTASSRAWWCAALWPTSAPRRWCIELGHPDANKDGYVAYPDINVVEEMANMITTMWSYEVNVQAIQDVKTMFNKALQIAR